MGGIFKKTLDETIRSTDEFVASVPKGRRKKYGQFFTAGHTAEFMASLFNFDLTKDKMRILDTGAGTGILSTAVIDRLSELGYKGEIHVTCYETDASVLPLLRRNLDNSKARNLSYEIIEENYITSQNFNGGFFFRGDEGIYDYVIGNPPYLKIRKDAPEAKAMREICHGAPNLYFLFWAMGVQNLKPGQELVYIVPRSWTSGAYFHKFRQYLFSECVITDIHLFRSRDRVFDGDPVLQETVIVKVRKTKEKPDFINVTSSENCDFAGITRFRAPYHTVVARSGFVYLVTDERDEKVLGQVETFTKTLPQINLRMQTGIIVDFRAREVLRDDMENGAYPLIYAHHIKDGRVTWPTGKAGEVIKTDRKALLQENADFLMVKRFTSKEEKRRLQCGIFLKKRYPQFHYISTQNKINFIKCDSPCAVYGLYVLLNSTLYDSYYRILNGSTQVNSTEINQMPVPDRQDIEEMGRELMRQELTVDNCNKILSKWAK